MKGAPERDHLFDTELVHAAKLGHLDRGERGRVVGHGALIRGEDFERAEADAELEVRALRRDRSRERPDRLLEGRRSQRIGEGQPRRT